jgi:arylformamidase
LSRIIDLSHTLRTGMTVYPGTEPPVVEEACSVDEDGFSERLLKMYSHTGTHIDVPAHIIKDGKSITDLAPEKFCGRALKIRVSKENKVTADTIKAEFSENGIPDFVIFQTGWEKFWDSPNYFKDFPLPDFDAFEYLVKCGVKGLGIDAISIDPVGSFDLPNHRTVFSGNMVIIENLTNLDSLPGSRFEFFCFPLKIENGDGSPIRAVAKIE